MLGWRHASLREFGAVIHALTLLAGGLATIAATLVAQPEVRDSLALDPLVQALTWALVSVGLGTVTMVLRGLYFGTIASLVVGIIGERYDEANARYDLQRLWGRACFVAGVLTAFAAALAGYGLILGVRALG